jgi:hypothetical protein
MNTLTAKQKAANRKRTKKLIDLLAYHTIPSNHRIVVEKVAWIHWLDVRARYDGDMLRKAGVEVDTRTMLVAANKHIVRLTIPVSEAEWKEQDMLEVPTTP